MMQAGFQPLTLNENEQIVFSEQARVLPTLTDLIAVAVFAPTLMLVPWLIVHRLFRRTVYLITTQRVLIDESDGVAAEMALDEIVKFRGTRKSLLIVGAKRRLWVARCHDAWRFETIVERVIKCV
ncbi:hypothetical protein [Falsiruegeria mediterranea]|uniref:DUF304 domain-containing protein n=1 Tax=Falsiruegeria mediterranea M17 TaxID=1200281 RepID=A0A2R8CFN8_9RHOB|nr:hypothetical protein [Falsiruegeria mediterranea]SPJ31245.1 hypothetical protein TRM7615_04788 [Falsiruegeria mediterranea M17]